MKEREWLSFTTQPAHWRLWYLILSSFNSSSETDFANCWILLKDNIARPLQPFTWLWIQPRPWPKICGPHFPACTAAAGAQQSRTGNRLCAENQQHALSVDPGFPQHVIHILQYPTPAWYLGCNDAHPNTADKPKSNSRGNFLKFLEEGMKSLLWTKKFWNPYRG